MAESLVFQAGSAAPPSLNIPSESQTFTSNGTFTAPDDGSYIVILNAPIAKTGSGGRGGYAAIAEYNWAGVGGGGGAGGSAYKATSPGIISVSLNKNDQVQVTVNTSISSFGNYVSFSCGTAPGNGSAGGSGSAGSSSRPENKKHGQGGAGGAGGGKPVFSASQESTIIISPNLPDANLTGGTGTTASGQYYNGEDGAKEVLTGIYKNAGDHIEDSGSTPLEKVRAGEVALGFGLRQQAVADKADGLPIDYVDPAEGTFSLTESVAVVDKGDESKDKAMEMAQCIIENGREELQSYYPLALYNGEKTDADNRSANPKVFSEPLTVDLLEKHQALSEECK